MKIDTYISGCGEYFPENRVTNKDLMELMDTSDEWIYTRTGIKERRHGLKDELASDMSVYAAKQAIQDASLGVDDIDYILYSITYSEQSFPNTAARLQQKLNIKSSCPCLDINAACTGWLYGLELADSLIKSRKYKNILLVGCEKPSTFLNMKDRNTAVLFGDGCGAVVVSAHESDTSLLIDIKTKCDSRFIDELSLENGGIRNPITEIDLQKIGGPFNLHMNGKKIFKEAVSTMTMLCNDILEKHNIKIEDIDWLIPHQANSRIIDAVGKKLEISEDKVLLNIENYGNTSSATIPTTLTKYKKNNNIKRGDLILMTSFGAGLTSSAALMRF